MNKNLHSVTNPIIPGFYSDPSVCRDGEDYYLVNSSFEFYPGVPVFHSRDLVNWNQISYCLSTPSQLLLDHAGTSDGIYAPTIRKSGDTFYMITSNRSSPRGNHFIVTAKSPYGPWSTPQWIQDCYNQIPDGVDPSLFFDFDGKCYFSCVAWDENGQGIGQAEIDLNTCRLVSPLKIVWHGTGGTFPEGPHTYHIGEYYYLMIAEGGTEFGHKVTIARSKEIHGPYESCPRNPVLTQIYQKAQSCSIQGVGHGDLFQAHDNTWWMIVHGFRTSIGKLHHLGRETLLIPITWDDEGWPVANKKGWIDETIQLQGAFSEVVQRNEYDTIDRFKEEPLPLYWNYLRNPVERNYIRSPGETGISLIGSACSLNEIGSPTWLGRRQQHFNCKVYAEIEFNPCEADEVGLTVFQTNEHHYDLVFTQRNKRKICFLRKVVGDICQELPPVEIKSTRNNFIITAGHEIYDFKIQEHNNIISLGTARTQLISTEAMQYQNFTGTYLAAYAYSPNKSVAPAKLLLFEYRGFSD